jgi:predicted CXXCH cytochrome family protein
MDMQDEMKKKVVHGAVLGGCTSCHNPHGSSYKKLLPEEGEKLCFQCHAQVAETVQKAKVVHAPVKTEKACASCHSPHASNNDKLLSKSGKDLCLDCHKNIIKKNMTVLHGPIITGKCIPCHDPHGSKYSKLLAKEFTSEVYVSYNDKEYELCFSCHNRDLLRFPDTSFATGFRDGDRNLHYLHVNKKEKGRNCKLCHNIHGGGNPKLIADSAPFGKWELPLKFVKTETGGSCSPGCHKTYNYDRKTPGKAPEPEKPKEKGKEKK